MQTSTGTRASGKKPNGAVIKGAAKRAAGKAKRAARNPAEPKKARAKGPEGKPELREGSVASKAFAFWSKELESYKKLEDLPRGELSKVGKKISSKFGIKSGVSYSYFFARTYGLPKSRN